MAQTQQGSVEAPKAWDIFMTGTGAMVDTLENINPNSTVKLFPTVYVNAPDLSAILKDVPEESWY